MGAPRKATIQMNSEVFDRGLVGNEDVVKVQATLINTLTATYHGKALSGPIIRVINFLLGIDTGEEAKRIVNSINYIMKLSGFHLGGEGACNSPLNYTPLPHPKERSFAIDYEKNSFSMDGKPFRYVSGSVHYFRVPSEYWRDRLQKVRAAGLNAVSTYVEWSQHCKTPDSIDFGGNLNITRFIQIAKEEDLYVILRIGPYICAERDMGGLPYWLLTKYPDIKLRTSDPRFKTHVEDFMDKLMAEVSPLLYGRGGPIILVQVENEYGSYFSCDYNYTSWLRDVFKKHVRNDAVLFTTDGASKRFLKCGKIPGVYATVDFGPETNVTNAFAQQRIYEPKGPLVNSEYYPGWLTHWGEKMARKNIQPIVKTLKEMLDLGANVNFYMFHGGSNFGFTAGANYEGKYQPDITSYDYDAPITEAGDITQKYNAIKEVVIRYLPSPNKTVHSSEKGDYGKFQLNRIATLFSPKIRSKLGKLNHGKTPRSFESLNQNFGYLLYETDLPKSKFNSTKGTLYIENVKDLAQVYYKARFLGILSREFSKNSIEIEDIQQGGRLSVIVENLGRINFGAYINDSKGILDVRLQGQVLYSWNMTSFELENLKGIEECAEELENNRISECDNKEGFVFYMKKFKLPQKGKNETELDTYLNVSHLTKGLAFINGFNLGRYWSLRGPQYTLYVPGVYLKSYPKENTLIIMEENITSDSITVEFIKTPIFT